MIRYANILALFILIFGLWIFMTMNAQIFEAVNCILQIAQPANSLETRFVGLASLALLCLTLVAAIRLLVFEQRRDP